MFFTRDVVLDFHTIDRFFAQHFHGFCVVEHFDVVEAVDAVLHGFGGAHDVSADEHGHLGAKLREVARLLARAVAGAHDDHFLVAVEEPVAHGAGTHATTCVTQAEFALQSEPLGRSTCADDDRVGVDLCFLVVAHPHLVHGAAEVHLGDPAVTNVGVEALGLVFEVLHHLGTVDACRVTWEVVHFCGLGQLTTWLLPLVEDGLHVCACSVDGGGVSSGAGSHDQAAVMFRSAHGVLSMWHQK